MKKNVQMKKIFVIILIAVLIISSCKNIPSPEKQKITTATLKGPSAMSMIRMIDRPDTLIGGFSTEFEIKNEPNQVRMLILNEQVDFAVVPSTMGALLYNKTGKYILAAVPVWGTLYLFGSDTSIHTWSDLKGKTVSLMAKGMTPDIMFRYLAEKNGVNPAKDIKLDYSFPSHIELSNAIAAGLSDLGVISEPLVSIVSEKNKNVKPLINFNSEWIKLFGDNVPFAQTALLVHKDIAGKYPGAVDDYLEKLERSIQWVNLNPEKAAGLFVKHKIMPDSATAVHSIPRCNLKFSHAGEEMNGIQEYFKVFYNFNPSILGDKLPDEKFYYKKKSH